MKNKFQHNFSSTLLRKKSLVIVGIAGLFTLGGCVNSDQEITIKADGKTDMYTRGSFAFGQIEETLMTFMEMGQKLQSRPTPTMEDGSQPKEGVGGLFSEEVVNGDKTENLNDLTGGMDFKGIFGMVFGMMEGMVMEEFKSNAKEISKIKLKGVLKQKSSAWSGNGTLNLETWVSCKDMKTCISFSDKIIETSRKKAISKVQKPKDPLFGGMMPGGGNMEMLKDLPKTEFKSEKNKLTFTIPFKKGNNLLNSLLKGMPAQEGAPFKMEEMKGLAGVMMSGARIQLRINTPKPIKKAVGNPLRPSPTSAVWEIPLSKMFSDKIPKDFVGSVSW